MAAREHELPEVTPIAELVPWEEIDISFRPYPGLWSFNPCIHFDGTAWRCVLRCADYAMPNGHLVRTQGAKARVENRCALVELDPKTWQAAKVYLMHERDGLPRNAACASVGYEDMRIFAAGGALRAIAASLHLARDGKGASVPPEQVLLTLGSQYEITEAQPIRGPWSGTAQKNWMPFDGADEPRFLYSIERGIVYGASGPEVAPKALQAIDRTVRNVGGTEIRMMRKPFSLSTGKTAPITYDGLRGGSQLLLLETYGDDASYLGIGHEMRYVHGKKFYWHTFFSCSRAGKLERVSPPVKLSAQGIEFAAGLAIDGDRLVVSYGVDDALCKLGVTSLEAVLATLAPYQPRDPASGKVFKEGVRTFDPRAPGKVYASVDSRPTAKDLPAAPIAVPATGAAPSLTPAPTEVAAGVRMRPQKRTIPPPVSPDGDDAEPSSRALVLLDAAREAIRASRTHAAGAAAPSTRDAAWAKLLAALEGYGDCFYDAKGAPR